MSDSNRERFFFYNTLSILLKAALNERTTVDLRNEASVYGTIEHVDAFMNIVMKNCVFTDPRGDCFDYDMFFIHARNIRCVQIPPKIRIIPAIQEQIKLLSASKVEERSIPKKWTYKQKRALAKQLEGITAMEQILQEKREEATETVTGNEDQN